MIVPFSEYECAAVRCSYRVSGVLPAKLRHTLRQHQARQQPSMPDDLRRQQPQASNLVSSNKVKFDMCKYIPEQNVT